MSHRKTHTIWFHSHVDSKKTNTTKHKQTHRIREQTGVARGEGDGGISEIGRGD